jgi:hypothetical protein
LPEGSKIIKISAVSYIDKTGKKKIITAKKEKLTAILKVAEKEGALWKKEN